MRKRFWELQEIKRPPAFLPHYKLCEEIFSNIVSLPFHCGELRFADSRFLAVKRFMSLVKRLFREPLVYEQ